MYSDRTSAHMLRVCLLKMNYQNPTSCHIYDVRSQAQRQKTLTLKREWH